MMIRRRSGCPLKRTPARSNTSRSSQLAPFQTGVTLGIVSPGRSLTLSLIRWFFSSEWSW